MKLIGGLICFLAMYGFTVQVTGTGVLWMLFGVALIVIPTVLEGFMRTERFIHRSNNKNVNK